MTTTTRPLVLNVTEAGNLLGVSRSTAYELVRSVELESIRLRRRVVVPVVAIARRLGVSTAEVWSALRPPSAPTSGRISHGRAAIESMRTDRYT